ncbi:PIN domain-containing protein [candidate division WOR-3 bacterium]|nr:PIN domain-containing protein [candidate division WOR-3 bacterium]
MTLNVELFKNVTTPVSKVYMDSNFILTLFWYIQDPTNRLYSSSKKFYEKLRKNGTLMWTSILGLEEVIWIVLRNNILDDMHQQGLTGSISDLKRNHPTEYINTFKKLKPLIQHTFRTFAAFGIQLHIPTPFKINGRNKAERIAKYACLLMDSYEIEAADAFHIAFARCEGTKFIVSNDTGFQDVATISVYSYYQKS